jgi:ribose transport system substrate-binding protein
VFRIARRHILGGISALIASAALPVLAEDAPLKVTVLLFLTSGEFSTEIKAGANAAAKDLGFPIEVRFAGPSSFDPQKQAAIFQNEALTKPDAIIVGNVASALFVEPVLEAQKQGITVAWFNSAPAAEFYDGFFVSADPTAMGKAAAGVLAKTLEAKLGKPAADIEGQIYLGLCVPGLSVLENRVGGTRIGISKLMPKVEMPGTIATKPDREGNFAAWNQAIRKDPNALAYLDGCEAGQQNIAQLIREDKLAATSVAYDLPEDVRIAIRDGIIPAATPSSFFAQGYMSLYVTAKALHEKKPLPKGWLKIAPLVIDSANIGQYIEDWAQPETGLREFFAPELERARAAADKGEVSPIGEYDNPPAS